ncbi:MAG: ABC transporter permease [Scytonema hyalinum WJT4-NPBG1]|jgi:ABC-2 type transport system permease protein|nr:ABC transporter permease [Scytonema hyalinum WJT4-NPBG1]
MKCGLLPPSFEDTILNICQCVSPIPLCVLPLAGLGALIGTNARTPQESDSFSLLLTMVMLFIGPVIIPDNRLPDILLYIGRLSPATYAASALRQTLLGPITGQVVVDLTALVGFSLLTFWWVGLKLDWRQR